MRKLTAAYSLILITLIALSGCGGGGSGQTPDVQIPPQTRPMLHAFGLTQNVPGDEPFIRLTVDPESIPESREIFAWLLFRSDRERDFAATPETLVQARLGPTLIPYAGHELSWPDDSNPRSEEVTHEFEWITPDRTERKTGLIDLSFECDGLVAGHTYYYRTQIVVEPRPSTGEVSQALSWDSPLSTIASTGPHITVTPPDALTPPSPPSAGVTYLKPPLLWLPHGGAQSLAKDSITFESTLSTGADEYVLQVFSADDPDGRRTPLHQIAMVEDDTGRMTATIDEGLAPNSRFYWRVGAKRLGEPMPRCGGRTGWLLSGVRTFTTGP